MEKNNIDPDAIEFIINSIGKYKNAKVVKSAKVFDLLKKENVLLVDFTHDFTAYGRTNKIFAQIKLSSAYIKLMTDRTENKELCRDLTKNI
jgi:hypothetical protein